jgi:ABC-type nickel/cobalt efflux system permease component RcnA
LVFGAAVLFYRNKRTGNVNDVVFITLLATGFAVGFLHAVIPTHWLPFVVAARTQRWSKTKTLAITGFAGAGHVIFTTALGVLVVWGGIAINSRIGNAFPYLAGGALIVLGIFYLIRQIKGGHGHAHLFGGHSRHAHSHEHEHEHKHGHEHHHDHDGHPHHHDDLDESIEEEERALEQDWSRRRSDWAAILGLLALLTFSPCEAFLPVFLTGAKYGWFGFALLSLVLAVATVAGMITFTWLTLLGLQRLRFRILEKYEPMIVSAVFCILGVLVIMLEH